MEQFIFNFDGENAKELREQFMAHYWDGGLDQHIEESFLEGYGLDSEDVEFAENGNVIIHTDRAQC